MTRKSIKSDSFGEAPVKKSQYGRKGQEWHPAFLDYMESIAHHEVYKGMPDAFRQDGTIQWEAPSNRKSGKYKDTHHKRREWWRTKATAVGIDARSTKWISKVAKAIHPTQRKPCKRCGRVMELRYAYPSKILINRIKNLDYIDDDFELTHLEDIMSLMTRLYERYGDIVFRDLHDVLRVKGLKVPTLGPDLNHWLEWLDSVYLPSEPAVLSPGAMSNAPDRFDGFHSFNLCCRSKADTGRHIENLRSYTTDRRVFEYWTEGDWIAADRLTGEVRSCFRDEPCMNGHAGPCDADHIGPISLGFCHRPDFQLLCTTCNSAKNNRMTYQDVSYLRNAEEAGAKVVSWYAERIWDSCKAEVLDEETALRLSKILRDNRQNAISILNRVAEEGNYIFLTSYLGLEYANYDVKFINLRIDNHRTRYDDIVKTPRTTKYTLEQKARRVRVAFESLLSYRKKAGRNAYIVSNSKVDASVHGALMQLGETDNPIKILNNELYGC